jgi:hypothetical protein
MCLAFPVAFWRQLSFFFLCSSPTSIHKWLRLPWQAADGRPAHPVRPPPLPDPTCQHFVFLLDSLGFLAFMPPFAGSLWCHLGLVACWVMVRAFFGLLRDPFPQTLDRYSNTKARPSWFTRRHGATHRVPLLCCLNATIGILTGLSMIPCSDCS